MKNTALLIIAIVLHISAAFSQVQGGINYQAMARDASGKELANEQISVQFQIISGTANGALEYEEEHQTTTNEFGLFTLEIGTEAQTAGSVPSFDSIPWGAEKHYLNVTINGTDMGTTQFVAVPYAYRARTVDIDRVNDADSDPANEIQNLTLTGNSLAISGGNSVVLQSFVDTDDQDLTLNGNTLNITDGLGVDLSQFMDNTDAQTLSFASPTLTLTNGGNVNLSGLNTDAQTLSFASPTLSLTNGGNVDLSVLNTDAQQLTFATPILTLTNGGNVNISGLYTAGTGIQITGTTIASTAAAGDVSGTYPTLTVTGLQTTPIASTTPTAGQALVYSGTSWAPATPPNDGDWLTSGTNLYNGNTGFVGIGLTSPKYNLHVHESTINTISYGLFTNVATGSGVGDGFAYGVSTSGEAILRNRENTSMNFYTNNSERMRIIGTGNVGIGTITPSELLEVAGNVEIPAANEYQYATAKTKYVQVPTNALHSMRPDLYQYTTNTYVFGYDGESGYSFFQNGTYGNDAVATAPLYLPDGATITSLEIKWFDQDANYNATVSIERVSWNTINNVTIGSISTTGSTTSLAGMVTSSAVLSHVVNSNTNSYYVKFKSIQNATALGVAKVRITYTVIKTD